MTKNKTINVKGTEITIISQGETDFICLTDMTSNFNEGSGLIGKWITTKNTLEYLSIWESINHIKKTSFNCGEFDTIKNIVWQKIKP